MVESKFVVTDRAPDIIYHQIYLWFITSDQKVIIVSTKPGKYQLPGGKPNPDESHLDTIKRECFEEAGLELMEGEVPIYLGHYVVTNDPRWPEKEYAQLRYFVKSNRKSSEIVLSINEPEDLKMVSEAKFVELSNITQYIHWMKNSDEYNSILKVI